jgi:hypothetical protein
MKYKIWDKKENIYTPSGHMSTAEDIFRETPLAAVPGIKFIICDAPINGGVFMEFTQTRDMFKQMGAPITNTMSDQQVLDAITNFENRKVEALPTSEERMAAAMEFQNLLELEDQ